jgi:hypothetical protein
LIFLEPKPMKKIVVFIPNKSIAINDSLNKVISFPETADKTFTYVTKVTGVATGAVGAAKDSVDLAEAEALVC